MIPSEQGLSRGEGTEENKAHRIGTYSPGKEGAAGTCGLYQKGK